MQKDTKKSFLIVGLGRLGGSLCDKLAELGQTVIGVDSMAGPVAEIADRIDVAAQLDVSDENALIKIGAKEVDVAVVTIGEALESSILCTSILVDLGVPLVIARASNPLHVKVLKRVGAHKVVSPEIDMGSRIAENLVYPWYSRFTKVEGGDFVFGKISPLPEMIGKTLAELRFSQKYKVVVVLVENNGRQTVPSSSRPFDKSDELWVLGHKEDMDKMIRGNDAAGIIDAEDINLTGTPRSEL
jgi:trk system potassium uptake protein TrkA